MFYDIGDSCYIVKEGVSYSQFDDCCGREVAEAESVRVIKVKVIAKKYKPVFRLGGYTGDMVVRYHIESFDPRWRHFVNTSEISSDRLYPTLEAAELERQRWIKKFIDDTEKHFNKILRELRELITE